MERVFEFLTIALRQIPEILVKQQNGIAFLSIVPFMLSSITLAQRDPEAMFFLETSTPQSFAMLPALFLFAIAFVALVKGKNLFAVAPFLSSIILLAMALKVAHAAYEIDGIGPAPAILAVAANISGYPELYAIYTVCIAATVASIVVRPTVSLWGFRTVAFILVADVFLLSFGTAFTVLGVIFVRYTPSPISVLTSLLALLFLRMIVKFLQENAPYLRDVKALSKDARRDMLRSTFALWWPMFAVFVICGVAYYWLDDRFIKHPLVRALNTYEIDNEVRVYPIGLQISLPDEPREFKTVEAASVGVVDYYIKQQNVAIAARIDAQVNTAGKTTDDVMQEMQSALPTNFPGTTKSDCGRIDPDCYFANIAKKSLTAAIRPRAVQS